MNQYKWIKSSKCLNSVQSVGEFVDKKQRFSSSKFKFTKTVKKNNRNILLSTGHHIKFGLDSLEIQAVKNVAVSKLSVSLFKPLCKTTTKFEIIRQTAVVLSILPCFSNNVVCIAVLLLFLARLGFLEGFLRSIIVKMFHNLQYCLCNTSSTYGLITLMTEN